MSGLWCSKHNESWGHRNWDNTCETRTDDTLTFAEAMALDPSEVEARDDFPYDDPQWFASTAWLYWTAANLRRCTFRRSRSKRSRVQEMALTHTGKERQSDARSDYEEAIRAVCEYLRERNLTLGQSDIGTAECIERHFLEPR